MTRIIGGIVGGRRIKTPTGIGTRPTADRVREALFSTLESELGTLAGRTFVDVYAGSGAIGLEARSRGASTVTCVENDRVAAAMIRANASALGLDGVHVVTAKAARWAAGRPDGAAFDVAFLDPPYSLASDGLAELLGLLGTNGWLAAGASVVLERSRRDSEWLWPMGFEGVRSRKYGETMLWYGHRLEQANEEQPCIKPCVPGRSTR
ncbi:MAG: 16S rRNA (guanine(966)-N(2))-methyltransferase RsmD [Propionibacteriales bacterium]|jgi:16S rRNA (guanine966-N2)-methyltransferase|nr:16S rRNA (guanine(966)-N(2))-methyltransferase RsmD [Propionibacteriales bacterium]